MRSDNMLMVHANNHYKAKNAVFEGELISAENTYNAPIGIEVLGKTEQVVTVQGKNLLDLTKCDTRNLNHTIINTNINDCIVTNNQSDISNGIARVSYASKKLLFLEKNKTYYVRFKAKRLTGDDAVLGRPKIAIYTSSDSQTVISWLNDKSALIDDTEYSFSFVNNTDNYVVIIFYSQSTATTTLTEGSAQFYDIMISTDNVAYEPFVPDSPSPDYPSDIKSVLSGTSVNAVGRNLWSLANYYYAHTDLGATSGVGGSYTLPINFHGTFTLSANITRYEDDVVVNPRLTMVIYYKDGSYNAFTGFSNNIPADGLEHLIYVTGSSDTAKTIDHISGWLFNYSSYTFRHIEASNIQLELSSTATTYQPYQSGGSLTAPCDLYEGDECQWLADKTEVTKAKEIYKFTGNETVTMRVNANNVNVFSIQFISAVYLNYPSALCNFYKYVLNYNTLEDGCFYVKKDGGALIFDNRFDTTEDYKTWLATQYAAGTPVAIVYELAEPQTVEYDAQTIPNSVPRHTNIYSIPEGLEPNIITTMKTY